MKNLIAEIAKLWPGHSGVNFETTTEENLLLLIRDAVAGDRAMIKSLGSGLAHVASERANQIYKGYDAEHDDGHARGELALAAACYAVPRIVQQRPEADERPSAMCAYPGSLTWPWEAEALRVDRCPLKNLAKAGALIVAEIERLQRAKGGAK